VSFVTFCKKLTFKTFEVDYTQTCAKACRVPRDKPPHRKKQDRPTAYIAEKPELMLFEI
jgi:hypothetical protein